MAVGQDYKLEMDYLASSVAERADLGDLVSSSHFGIGDINESQAANKSFQSVLSASTGFAGNATSSSKAVLAALRALQDKIRRLETERSQALDEVSHLRLQLKNQDIEAEHQKQRDKLSAQKSIQDITIAHERLQQEKLELTVSLQRMEEKVRIAEQACEDMQTKNRVLEEEKHNSMMRARDVEQSHQQMELQIKQAQHREQEMAQTLVWETKTHEEDVSRMQQRMSILQEELSKLAQEKGTLDGRIVELDQLTGQLLSLNESLVAQLSGKPWKSLKPPATSTVRKTKKLKAGTVPRVASLSTAASDNHKSATAKKTSLANALDEIEQLKALHKAYAKVATSLTRTMSPHKSEHSAAPSPASILKSPGTRLSHKKKRASSGHSSSVSGSASLPQTPDTQTAPPSAPNSASVPASAPTSSRTTHELRIPRASLESSSSSFAEAAAAPGSATAQSHELRHAISSLEDEFAALNRQYRRLLSSVSVDEAPSDAQSFLAQSVESRAHEIVSVIQKLHEKGEQLRQLKSPSRFGGV